jgi:hypothetical protein
LAAFHSALRQRVQLAALLGEQPIGQPSLDLPPRTKAEINTDGVIAVVSTASRVADRHDNRVGSGP